MIVYGKNIAIDYMESDERINKVYISENFDDEKILSMLRKRKIAPIISTKYQLEELVNSNHQGIILDVENYKYHQLSDIINNDENQTIVILDHLEDPHNLGAIIRTCEAAGINGIIIPKDRSVQVNSTVLKTSSGAALNTKIVLVNNLVQTIKELQARGFWVYGTDMDDAQEYDKVDYSGRTVIVIGNEGKGLSRLVRENCDFIIKIPILGKVNSLNASVAAGIIIYEVLRQKGNEL